MPTMLRLEATASESRKRSPCPMLPMLFSTASTVSSGTLRLPVATRSSKLCLACAVRSSFSQSCTQGWAPSIPLTSRQVSRDGNGRAASVQWDTRAHELGRLAVRHQWNGCSPCSSHRVLVPFLPRPICRHGHGHVAMPRRDWRLIPPSAHCITDPSWCRKNCVAVI